MHEMSLAEGVLQVIEDAAQRDRFSKVTAVWLEIGQLAGVEPQAMAFCFDAVTRGSVAEGARLEIVGTDERSVWRVPGLWRLPVASDWRHRAAGKRT